MVANEINGKIEVFGRIPDYFGGVYGYDELDSIIHYNDGFRDLVIPSLGENQKYGVIFFDEPNDNYTYEVIDMTAQEIAEEEAKKSHIQVLEEENRYIVRMDDGKKMYAEISAEIRISKIKGDITNEHHILIEETLRPVRDEVVNGQFITAKEKLEQIGSTDIGQTMYDDLISRINNYITNSYV